MTHKLSNSQNGLQMVLHCLMFFFHKQLVTMISFKVAGLTVLLCLDSSTDVMITPEHVIFSITTLQTLHDIFRSKFV